MECIEKSWQEENIALNPSALFLDIETTGLCKQNHIIFCIGILYRRGNTWIQTQWLIQKKEEEKVLLTTFLDALKGFNTLYTYSGTSFDLPFLCERLSFYGMDKEILLAKTHLDFRKVPFFKKLLKEKKISRIGLDESLHYKRTLTLVGKEIVKLYTTYSRSPLPQHKTLLLTHNAEELLSLCHMWKCYTLLTHIHFLDRVTHYETQTTWSLTFRYSKALTIPLDIQLESLAISYEPDACLLTLSVPLHYKVLKHYLPSYKEYYYIPSQGQIIHQSVAQFLPASMRQRATKEQCIVSKESIFIQLYPIHTTDEDIWVDEVGNRFIERGKWTEKELWQYIKKIINPRLDKI